MPGRPWWLRLDGVSDQWRNRPVAERSGATTPQGHAYYLVARGRGVVDWIPGFQDPRIVAVWVSWIIHGTVYPGQWMVAVEDLSSGKPRRVYRSETLKSRTEAVARLQQLKGQIESGEPPF